MSDSPYLAGCSVLTLLDAEVPDGSLSVDELGSRIVGSAGRLAAATCRWLLLVAEFDARDGCARFGLPSTARWLGHYCGLAQRTAVEHVRVARALAAFPALAQAMGCGRLSYAQVRAISRLARDGEDRLIADLIEAAQHGTAGQLETLVRGLRTVEQRERDVARPEEYVSHGWSADSQWRLYARLDPERGEVVQCAVETIARVEGVSQAAALVRMAEIALAALTDAGDRPRGLRGEERAAVVIHLTAADLPAEAVDEDEPGSAPDETSPPRSVQPIAGDALCSTSAERGMPDTPRSPQRGTGDQPRSAERARPYARIAGGPGLPDAVVKRLLCAGRIRTAVHDAAGNVRDLGRSHRVVTERLYRALLLRDGGCRHPGCGSTRDLQAHHVRHWIYGGATNLTNLLLLCEAHHHAHHDSQFRIESLGRARFRFLRPDGRVLPDYVDPSQHIYTTTPTEQEHADVAADAATTRWAGERLDRNYSVSVLAQRRERAQARAGGPASAIIRPGPCRVNGSPWSADIARAATSWWTAFGCLIPG